MTTPAQEKIHWNELAKVYPASSYTKEIVNWLIANLKDGKTLELGVGNGRLAEALSKEKNLTLVGIDISTNMMQPITPGSKVEYKLTEGRNIPYPDSTFDNIYAVNLFQHLDYDAKEAYVKEAARALKKGGVFIVQWVEGKYTGDYDHNITTKEIFNMLKQSGFKGHKIYNGKIHPLWGWIVAVK